MTRRRRTTITEELDGQDDVGSDVIMDVDFDDCLAGFIRSIKAKGRSVYTVKYYRQHLRDVRNLLEIQDVSTNINRIDRRVIERNIIEYMMEVRGNSRSTVNTRLRALKSFLNWARTHEMVTTNPMAHITVKSVDRAEIKTYTREQLRDLFRQPNLETFVGLRDYTIMTVFIETGVRVRELIDIKVSDVRFADSQILIHGKNGEDRLVPIQKKAASVLRRYMRIRGESPVDYLFISNSDSQLGRRTVQDRIAKYGRMAHITDVRNSPHTFRHTFAKMCVRNGASIFDLQKILGHQTFDMVRVYVNLFSTEIVESHKKFSPLENLNM